MHPLSGNRDVAFLGNRAFDGFLVRGGGVMFAVYDNANSDEKALCARKNDLTRSAKRCPEKEKCPVKIYFNGGKVRKSWYMRMLKDVALYSHLEQSVLKILFNKTLSKKLYSCLQNVITRNHAT